MPIHVPGKRLLRAIPLSFVRTRTGTHGRKAVDSSIPLIPFVDFLIVLVVFLLSVNRQAIFTPCDQIRHPDGVNTDTLQEAPVIAIGRDVVMLDGRRMADTASLASSSELTRIEQLVQDLETLAANWTILHPDQPFPATVVLSADVDTDFRILRMVMFSAAQAGYSNVSFAVNDRGAG